MTEECPSKGGSMATTISRRELRLALLALLSPLAACGRGSDASAAPPAATSAGGLKTLPARPDPCGYVSGADATRLIGPLARVPWQAKSADDTAASPRGHACAYPLAAGGPGGHVVAVELLTENATSFESAVGMVGGIIERQVGPDVMGSPDTPDTSSGTRALHAGWDYLGQMGNEVIGRVGHLGIRARWDLATVARDSVVKLVALMRDRIPDLPFAAYGDGRDADRGRNACALLTRAEAEAVLGPLSAAPYHSRDATAMADPTGTGCSYYAPGHRVFSIDAEWSQGRRLFPLLAGMRQTVESKTGAPSAASDTLEGPWDQAASGLDGTLYFLKDDRILTVSYRASKADLAGAVRLAQQAVTRLGAAP